MKTGIASPSIPLMEMAGARTLKLAGTIHGKLRT
jgi:hypothetical protein